MHPDHNRQWCWPVGFFYVCQSNWLWNHLILRLRQRYLFCQANGAKIFVFKIQYLFYVKKKCAMQVWLNSYILKKANCLKHQSERLSFSKIRQIILPICHSYRKCSPFWWCPSVDVSSLKKKKADMSEASRTHVITSIRHQAWMQEVQLPTPLHEVPTGSSILCKPGCKENNCNCLNPSKTVWNIVVYKLFNLFTFKSLSEQHFFFVVLFSVQPCFWCDKLLSPQLWKRKK